MAGKGKRLLLVEDDRDALTLTTKMLEALGHSVISFASGEEALQGIVGQDIEIALLDIMMPGMNGYELLGKLREMPQFRELPIVFLTAKDKDSEILEGYTSGATYYITKPFTTKQLEYGIKIVTE